MQGGSHIFPPLNGALHAEVGPTIDCAKSFSCRLEGRAFSLSVSWTSTDCKQFSLASSTVTRAAGGRAPGPCWDVLLCVHPGRRRACCWLAGVLISVDPHMSPRRMSVPSVVHCYSGACLPGDGEAIATAAADAGPGARSLSRDFAWGLPSTGLRHQAAGRAPHGSGCKVGHWQILFSSYCTAEDAGKAAGSSSRGPGEDPRRSEGGMRYFHVSDASLEGLVRPGAAALALRAPGYLHGSLVRLARPDG